MSEPLYSAIKRSLAGRFLTYIVQFSALAIYARIFTPEQFGIITSIQVFVIFFQMLADVGIGPAIINEKDFSSKQRDGVFTVTLMLGLLLSVIFYLFSYLLNSFYGGYEYQSIALIISFSIIFHSLSIVPITALNKDAQFIKIAKADSVAELLSLGIVYILFLLDFGVLALACKTFSQSIFRFILVRQMSSVSSLGRPNLGSEIGHIKKLAGFASYQLGFNFINYFSRNLDNILIAKHIGTASLGVYDKSYQLMRYPLMLTTFAMTPAIQPVLTKIRDDVDKVVKEHNKLAERLLFISILISAFLYLNSENIVLLLLGEQWVDVVPLIEVFSFMIPIQAVLSTSGSFFQVMNRPRLLFISGLMSAVVNVTAICIGIYFGDLKSIATSLVVSFSINFIQCYVLMFKFCFRVSAKDFLIHLLTGALCAGLPVVLYITSIHLLNLPEIQNTFFNLTVNGSLALGAVLSFISLIKKKLL